MKGERLAIGLMIAQSFLFAIETAMIHQVGPRVSVMLFCLLRAFAGLVLVAIMARNIGWSVVRTNQLPMQLLRGVVSAGYGWVMMYSFSYLPFADATAISYTQAFYVAIFSGLILREQVTAMRWIAACLGIAGAVLIAKPGFLDWHVAYVVALIGTSLNGLAFVLNRYVQRAEGDSDLTTMFYVNLVLFVASLPVLATPDLPPFEVWPWLSGVLFFGPVGMYLGIVAVRHAFASALAPYTFLRLVIAVVGGIVLFRELPDLRTLVGVATILASCVLALPPATLRHPFRPAGAVPP